MGDTRDSDAFLRAIARAPDRAPDVPDPTHLAHFRIVSRLGSGGMGVVYKAEDEKLRRVVALKLLLRELGTDDDHRMRFLREARSAAAITHPNVATVYEVGEVDGCAYLAMEYIDGKTLRQVLGGGALPISEAVRIATQIARGLSKAHERGIVHRDLKPENVMLDGERQVRVLDFGIAKLREAPPGVSAMADTVARPTQAGRVLGTPGYMAPEQARGEIVDHRADLFSLGVVLYEAVAGVPPFRGETGFDVLVATIRDAPAPLSELRRDLPAALDAIVQRCLAKAPDDRFPSAQALTDALDGLTANPATTPVTPPRAPLRWRRGSALAVALGVGLVAFGAVAKWRHPGAWPMPAPPAPPSASPPAPTALTDLPPPPTRSPEVAAEFGAGMQALRDNGWTSAGRHFTRALELDPTLALAHLRVAMISFWRDPVQMREHFAKALALRSQLTARDRVLLEALEPVLQRVHADPREALARLERASQRYPLDVEFFDWLAILRYGDPERALASSERAIELDAKDGQAWQNEGIALMLLARTEEARAAYERCATIAGDSVDCLGGVVLLDAVEGHCDTYEADTRRFYDRDPWVYPGLATTMVARGRPEAAVLEVLEQGAALEHDADPARRAIDETGSRGALAMFAGDVARAGELARRNLLAVSSNPTTRTDFALRLDSVILLVQALVESGREDEARAVARDFFAQGTETWITTPGDGIEPSLSLLRLTVGHGGPSSQEFATRRDTWIAERLQTSLAYPGLVWTYAYAATATTPDEARMALEVLPRFVPLTSFDWQRTAYPDAYIGHTYLLAGRPEEAIPYLSRAVGNCQILFFAFARMRAALDLGQAREAAGDRPGACAAYAVVIDRWGNARPHSVTAEKAKDRFKAITCPLR